MIADIQCMITSVINAITSANVSSILTAVFDAVNNLIRVRQVALAGDTDSVTLATLSVNRGGTITTGGTVQQVMAENADRKLWKFQNNSPAIMMLGFGITPSETAGQRVDAYSDMLESNAAAVETDEIKVWCPLTGAEFSAREMSYE